MLRVSSSPTAEFHVPNNPLLEVNQVAAAIGGMPEIVAIEVPAGSLVIHHGRTWHGSCDNHGTGHRRSIVAHCMSSAARFNPDQVSPIYGRYKRAGLVEMDESFFPVLWRSDGYHTSWLGRFISGQVF
jgi:ectoine hydroxylase-related dioxygenase (phytanoyl-CoA dioxygenase family)